MYILFSALGLSESVGGKGYLNKQCLFLNPIVPPLVEMKLHLMVRFNAETAIDEVCVPEF